MEAIEQTMAVAAVLALLFGTLWWLRRRALAGVTLSGKRGGPRLELREHLALGPQQVLHLVQCGRHTLLLATSPAGCVLIERVPIEKTESEIRSGEADR